jgi:hypothetical protein
MSVSLAEPISEYVVQELLVEVQAFRQEWRAFAIESQIVFDAFREDGASLPDSFHSGYVALQQRKAALAGRIAERVVGLDADSWAAPLASESLQEFEEKLADLAEVARELARVITEKRDRYFQTLNAVASLESPEASIQTILTGIKQDSEQETRILATNAARLADLYLEEKINSFDALLKLVDDARARWNPSAAQTKLSSTDCQAIFETVAKKFGIVLAIEALRNGLCGALPTAGLALQAEPAVSSLPVTDVQPAVVAEMPLHNDESPASDQAVTSQDEPLEPMVQVPAATYEQTPASVLPTAAAAVVTNPATPATAVLPLIASTPIVTPPPVVSEIATRNQIQALVESLGAKPHLAPVLAKKTVAVAAITPAILPNPVSLSELARAGTKLKQRADEIWPEALNPAQLENNLCEDKIRAMGYGCLSTVIEMAGYVFTERERSPRFFSKLLHEFCLIFAEVLTAVRTEAIDRALNPVPEQDVAFRWLKHTCSPDGEKIHLERFMRLEDRAEPANNPKLTGRVLQQSRQLNAIRKREQVFQDLKRCCHQLADISELDTYGLATPMWTQVNNCVRQLILYGVKPTEVALREVLLPIVDSLPETVRDENGSVIEQGIDPSDELRSVIAAIHAYLSQEAETPGTGRTEEPTQDVKDVRSWLKGKTMVIVGGVCKPQAAARIKRSFELAEVDWLEASKQDRVSGFRSELKDASLVVLITKIIGHKHNDIRQMAKDAGIPYVQLRQTSGYSPNAIAKAVVEQASEQLQTA